MKQTLTITELAAYIGVARRTIYNMIEDGRFSVKPIKGTSPKRWSCGSVDKWLADK